MSLATPTDRRTGSPCCLKAYDLFSALRLEHQIQQLERGDEPDDYVDPHELSELTRRYLRDAFREVAAVQKSLSSARV